MLIGSVDPGKAGAITVFVVKQKAEVVQVLPMPLLTIKSFKGRGKNKKSTNKTEIDWSKVLIILQDLVKQGLSALVIEKQQKNRKVGGKLLSGSASSGTTMEQYGILKGICIALGIQLEEVTPSVWPKHYSSMKITIPEWVEKLNYDDTKKRNIATCLKLFPDVSLYKSSRCSKPSDGFADAILIGNWYIEKNAPLEQAA